MFYSIIICSPLKRAKQTADIVNKGKKILIVSHGGISIPIKCYFNGIPDIDTLLPLCIDNCEVVSFNYTDRDKLKRLI